jgi:hypothetical protein
VMARAIRQKGKAAFHNDFASMLSDLWI